MEHERKRSEKSKERLLERERLIQERMEEKKEQLRLESIRKRREAQVRVQRALDRNDQIMMFVCVVFFLSFIHGAFFLFLVRRGKLTKRECEKPRRESRRRKWRRKRTGRSEFSS